jgi:epsilon-lactone hydrolase
MNSPRTIPGYSLEVPGTVSPELQKRIADSAASVAPEGSPFTDADIMAAVPDGWLLSHDRVAAFLDEAGLEMIEDHIDGAHMFRITPVDLPAENAGRLLVNIHGGGYTLGAGEAGLLEALRMAAKSRTTTVAIDYRMPPAFPFPVPMDDAIAIWRHVTKSVRSEAIGLFGASTGGAMVLCLIQRAIAEGLPLPAALISITPWSDLSETGDSYFTNRHLDPMVYQGVLSVSAELYAAGNDFKDPRLSPVYGSFEGFPPTLLISGTRDLFLSNTIRVDRKLRDAGRDTNLIVYEGQTHGAFLDSPALPETDIAYSDMEIFFDRHLAR